MGWQFMQDGEICGPLEDMAFDEARKGLAPDTRVYKEGWKSWRKLGDLSAAELPQAPLPPSLDESVLQASEFWRRAGAFLLDYFLMRWLASYVSSDNGFQNWSGSGNGWFSSYSSYSYTAGPATWLMGHFEWQFVFTLVYETIMICVLGWTLGKFVFGIKVMHQGRLLSWQRSLMRVLAKKLNLVTFFIGYLMAAWDKSHKALHDYLCSTRVFLR